MPFNFTELFVGAVIGIVLISWVLHQVSYVYIKTRILESRRWDLNLCCGKTDGKGINVDITQHKDVPNFHCVEDIYNLPFADKQFEWVLCSHTAEHVEDPMELDRELRRVGKNVVYVLPPLWDLGAVFNIFEHRWIFLSFRKSHNKLPPFIRLPFADTVQRWFGQRIAA